MSSHLQTLSDPKQIKNLTLDETRQLAEEIRQELITVLAKNGGHLGPNLGVVVHRERQLHDAEVRTKMPAVLGEDGDQYLPDFFGELARLINRQALDLFRVGQLLQVATHK